MKITSSRRRDLDLDRDMLLKRSRGCMILVVILVEKSRR